MRDPAKTLQQFTSVRSLSLLTSLLNQTLVKQFLVKCTTQLDSGQLTDQFSAVIVSKYSIHTCRISTTGCSLVLRDTYVSADLRVRVHSNKSRIPDAISFATQLQNNLPFNQSYCGDIAAECTTKLKPNLFAVSWTIKRSVETWSDRRSKLTLYYSVLCPRDGRLAWLCTSTIPTN